MQSNDARAVREFCENEAQRMAHQEIMYFQGDKYELWWHRKRLRHIFSFLTEAFRKNEVVTFADIGCAEGSYIRQLAPRRTGTFYICTDIARTYVVKAKLNLNLANVDFAVSDIRHLPFKDKSIDIVLCSEVLEHVYGYLSSLHELNRITAKTLVLSFPGHTYLYQMMIKIAPLRKLADSLMPKDVGHVSEVTIKSVEEALRCCYASLRARIGGIISYDGIQVDSVSQHSGGGRWSGVRYLGVCWGTRICHHTRSGNQHEEKTLAVINSKL